MDLIPKFLMANGQLVKLLVHTGSLKEIFGNLLFAKKKLNEGYTG